MSGIVRPRGSCEVAGLILSHSYLGSFPLCVDNSWYGVIISSGTFGLFCSFREGLGSRESPSSSISSILIADLVHISDQSGVKPFQWTGSGFPP